MVDINCDMGEGMLSDGELMPFISSANIACGYHAGDAYTMHKTIELCLRHDIAIGAHPSFDDRANFGRTETHLPADVITSLVYRQLEVLQKVCSHNGTTIYHIKPHGALYNMAARDQAIAKAIVDAVVSFDKNLLLFGLSGSHLISEGEEAGLVTVSEVFADRTYQPDGSLTPRSLPHALITENNEAVRQVLNMIQKNQVTATNGKIIFIKAETICIHGDGDHAVDIARYLYETLLLNSIEIKAPQKS